MTHIKPVKCTKYSLISYKLINASTSNMIFVRYGNTFNIGMKLASNIVGINIYRNPKAMIGMTMRLNQLISLYQCSKKGLIIIGISNISKMGDLIVLSWSIHINA